MIPGLCCSIPGSSYQGLPALINCHVCRAYWHVGVGSDGEPEWDRYTLVKQELTRLGMANAVSKIEVNIRQNMEMLWGRKLSLKPLKK